MLPDPGRSKRQALHARAFDSIGTRYEEAFPRKDGQLAATGWLIERLRPGTRVLDVGCGTGCPTARQLTDARIDVTGIDISTGMLELAKERVPDATFLELDVIDLDGSLGSFDAIVDFFSLLMLSRAEITTTLRTYHDLLSPGGYFLLAMIEEDMDERPLAFLGSPVRVTAYPRGVLRSVVARAGFEVLDLKSIAYTPATPGTWPEIQLFLYCRRSDH